MPHKWSDHGRIFLSMDQLRREGGYRLLGNSDLLERLCRQSRDARQRQLLRSAPRQRGEIPSRGSHQTGSHGNKDDRITAKLPALHLYQLSLPVPKAPAGAFDRAAAQAGKPIFDDKARCATCHVPPAFTEPGWNLHTAEEIGIDDFQAKRAPDDRYRTVPLRALWSMDKIHKGGFYHDGRFATLNEVVNHYDGHFKLSLSAEEKRKLI